MNEILFVYRFIFLNAMKFIANVGICGKPLETNNSCLCKNGELIKLF